MLEKLDYTIRIGSTVHQPFYISISIKYCHLLLIAEMH